MPNYDSLQHIFLIAMPQLKDTFFSQSVVYLWEYNEKGARGVIINKPLKAKLGDLLRHLVIPIHNERAEVHPMLLGGPVSSDQGFLIQRRYDVDLETGKVQPHITICSSRDDLLPLAEGEKLSNTLVAVGCAKWEPGQLDKELANNDWLVAPFNEATLFSVLEDESPNETYATSGWRGAVATMGFNLNNLSLQAGRA